MIPIDSQVISFLVLKSGYSDTDSLVSDGGPKFRYHDTALSSRDALIISFYICLAEINNVISIELVELLQHTNVHRHACEGHNITHLGDHHHPNPQPGRTEDQLPDL